MNKIVAFFLLVLAAAVYYGALWIIADHWYAISALIVCIVVVGLVELAVHIINKETGQ
jgi:hypothetical protein